MNKSTLAVTEDLRAIRRLLEDCKDDPFVRERTTENVSGPAPNFDMERFWWVSLGCLLTTQQRSTTGSPVDRFLSLKPFPLTLARCNSHVEKMVLETLTAFGCSRWPAKIARQAAANHAWLEKDGWPRMERWFQRLAWQRALIPQHAHARLEREAAHFAAINLEGIGPKQSRNLWQWLGLARYEIPLDSRVAAWINANLSVQVNTEKLGDNAYYEGILDYCKIFATRQACTPVSSTRLPSTMATQCASVGVSSYTLARGGLGNPSHIRQGSAANPFSFLI
jgi:hypothetical protein